MIRKKKSGAYVLKHKRVQEPQRDFAQSVSAHGAAAAVPPALAPALLVRLAERVQQDESPRFMIHPRTRQLGLGYGTFAVPSTPPVVCTHHPVHGVTLWAENSAKLREAVKQWIPETAVEPRLGGGAAAAAAAAAGTAPLSPEPVPTSLQADAPAIYACRRARHPGGARQWVARGPAYADAHGIFDRFLEQTQYLAAVRTPWVVEVQADEGASFRDAVYAWASLHRRHVIDTVLDPEDWPPLPSQLPCVVIQEGVPSHQLPPWPCYVQFVHTEPGAKPLAQAQHCISLSSTVRAQQLQGWIREGKLPAGTPARATVAQVLPILRHVHATSSLNNATAPVPAPSESCHAAPAYMFD